MTRIRELSVVAALAAIAGFLAVLQMYRWFPPITFRSGISLLVLAIAEAGWGWYVRRKIADGEIGVGGGRLHPLAVARSLMIAQASAWVGALVFGGWAGISVYLLEHRGTLAVAAADTPGALAAALCALVLAAAGIWLQHCCKSPGESTEDPDADALED